MSEQVEKKVWLIAGQCKPRTPLYHFALDPTGFSHRSEVWLMPDFNAQTQVEGFDRLPAFKLENEQVELLRALYQAQDDDGRKTIIKTCLSAWFNADCAVQVFAFLARYCSFKQTLQFLT